MTGEDGIKDRSERLTLSTLFGEFNTLKDKLSRFVAQSNEDIEDRVEHNDELKLQIKSNKEAISYHKIEIGQAKNSIKQLNKITGGN
jgi:methyl-accepting chemotaxis protein